MPHDPRTTVRMLVLDVDGVLTDGRVHLDSQGQEHKIFNVRDGTGLSMWRRLGHEVALISGRNSPAVEHRARELHISHVFQGSPDKAAALADVVRRTRIPLKNIAAMGDDLPDLPLLKAVACPIAVADAVPEVKRLALHITRSKGGQGAVREAVEHLLRSQGLWLRAVALYESKADATTSTRPPVRHTKTRKR